MGLRDRLGKEGGETEVLQKFPRKLKENGRSVMPEYRDRAFQIYRNGVVQDVFLFRKRKYLS